MSPEPRRTHPAAGSERVVRGSDPPGSSERSYGGRGSRVRLDGEEVGFALVADSFGEAPSPALDRAFGQEFGGSEPGRDVVHYGLPDDDGWNAVRETMRYELVRTQLALVAPSSPSSPSSTGPAVREDGVRLEEVDRLPDELDVLFERAAAPGGAVVVRDAATLDARYPAAAGYAKAVARSEAGVLGCAVLHAEGLPELADAAWIVDWLVADPSGPGAELLRAWARSRARAAGRRRLAVLLADTDPEWIAFQRSGFRAVPVPRYLVARSFWRPITRRWLHRHWRYTLGDFLR